MSFRDRLREKAQKAVKIVFATSEEAAERMAICQECPELRKPINQCRECGCLMDAKTKLSGASCPLGKW
jgi:siroheme synthase (precorrin-2 oxidase/ferrochelatase)